MGKGLGGSQNGPSLITGTYKGKTITYKYVCVCFTHIQVCTTYTQ